MGIDEDIAADPVGRGDAPSARGDGMRGGIGDGTPPAGGSTLSEEANAVLDLEETWWRHGRRKPDAIATLGLSQARYYLLLNRVLADPRARIERPELVGRLLRLRDKRADERAAWDGELHEGRTR